MKRKQLSVTDYYVIIHRGTEEINLGPYTRKEQAVAAGKRHSKPGDRIEIEKVKFAVLLRQIIQKEILMNWEKL